jgi:drug/metabolite transporter (DMT)-like permease
MDDQAPRLPALAACLATVLGGSAVVATRFAVGEIDPGALAFLRHLGAGTLILLLATLILRGRLLQAIAAADLPAILGLGAIQYAAFGWLFAAGLAYVPAARGALAIATYPVQTLILAALLGRERLTTAKVAGALIAVAGVAVALGDHAAAEGPDVWKGDVLLLGAAFLGSVYNVFSGPYFRRNSAIAVTGVQIVFGALLILGGLWLTGIAVRLDGLSTNGWLALAWLITIGGVVCFYLWIWALEHTAPSRVSIAVTLNPIAAALFGALVLAEPLTGRLAVGLMAVVAGLALANWPARPAMAVPR